MHVHASVTSLNPRPISKSRMQRVARLDFNVIFNIISFYVYPSSKKRDNDKVTRIPRRYLRTYFILVLRLR